MKKLWIIVAVLLFAVPAFAQMDTANEDTIEWDAVTTLSDGSPVKPTDTITYNVWTKLTDGTNIQPVANCQDIAETTCTITYTVEGMYYQGVSTLRNTGTTTLESAIAWSDVAANTQSGTVFGTIYYLKAAMAGGLRKN